MKYIFGNWKSNLLTSDINTWFKVFDEQYRSSKIDLSSLEIVICPSFLYLPLVKELVEKYKLPIKIGAQNISPYTNGSYTGEICAGMLIEYCQYVIIGHSERRSKFGESDEMLFEKTKRAVEAGLKPIYCIPDKDTAVPDNTEIVAYEPVWAIGSGKSDSGENADKVGKDVRNKLKRDFVFVYGGSVTGVNVREFLSTENINGVLPGKASMDPLSFWEILANAAKI